MGFCFGKLDVGLVQPIANWAKRAGCHSGEERRISQDSGETYIRQLGNRGALAHRRGVREPPIHIPPPAPETTRPPRFLASHTSRFLLIVAPSILTEYTSHTPARITI